MRHTVYICVCALAILANTKISCENTFCLINHFSSALVFCYSSAIHNICWILEFQALHSENRPNFRVATQRCSWFSIGHIVLLSKILHFKWTKGKIRNKNDRHNWKITKYFGKNGIKRILKNCFSMSCFRWKYWKYSVWRTLRSN